MTCSGSVPGSVDTTSFSWRWYVMAINGNMLEDELWIGDTGSHTYYILLGAPQSPMTVPWTEVLDYACDWASGKSSESSALEEITKGAYNDFGEDHEYDGWQTHAEYPEFNLTGFLNDDKADCQDMSAVVHVFTRAIGGTSTQVRMINTTSTSNGFWYKPILPIGWSNPTQGINWWNFHQVGWKSNVYDACLKLNPSSNPRIPVNEDIYGSYKNDLYYDYYPATWDPQTPKTYTTIY